MSAHETLNESLGIETIEDIYRELLYAMKVVSRVKQELDFFESKGVTSIHPSLVRQFIFFIEQVEAHG